MRRASILCLLLLCALVPGQTVIRRPIVVGGAPVFPINGVLDNFNRANEGPPPSTNWTDSIISGDGGIQVASNTGFGNTSPGVNSAFWNVSTFGPDCEAYVTFAVDVVPLDFGGVMARVQGAGTATSDGYYAQFYETGQQLFIKRIDNGVETVIHTVNSFNPASGDSIGLSAIGTSIELWYKVGAGAWTSKGSVTDATYGSAGHIGMVIGDQNRLEDFGGGAR